VRRLLLVLGLVFAVSCQQSAEEDTAATPPQVSTTTSTVPVAQPTTSVPNVEGKRADNARRALAAAGFDVSINVKFTDQAMAGTILHQSLDAGASVRVGRSIVLLVAKAFPVVPGVVGLRLTVAREALRAGGWDVRVTKQESSQPKDTVISQTPAGGTEARPGRQVTIVIAKPPAPVQSCTPGYSPCIPPGPDVDCGGGSGDGPRYVTGPVRVTGSDPYGLDSDNNGYGCE
jgi:beta-lactam-binding protein with PASTA domain